VIPRLTTFGVGGLGVAVFMALDLPLPWLLGPITGCLIAAMAGLRMRGIKPVNDLMRTILGVAVGATFTPVLLMEMTGYWPTLLMIPVMIFAIGLVGVPYFQRIWGFDFATSYYATMPGGLQDMLVFGEEAGGNVRTLSLIHATRVLVVVMALPFILKGVWGADLSNPPGVPIASVDITQLLVRVGCAVIGWQVAKRFGMFGASILGPMILAAVAALAGVLQQRPPAEAIWMAQFFIGMIVGAKYEGITMAEVRRDLTAGLGYCVILIVFTVIFAELIYVAGLAPPLETLLAFAPGGQAEMTILTLIVGADMAFVISHHVLRIVIVIIGAPLFAKMFAPKSPD
jgi:membrane AbrB-like protein